MKKNIKNRPSVKSSKKEKKVKKAVNVIQERPTDSDSDVHSIDGEDFGAVGDDMGMSSEDENRKNVNADPNLIQGNKLGKKK